MKQRWVPAKGKRMDSLKRFVHKPWSEKILCIKFLCLQIVGFFPVRLPFGSWWLAYKDYCGSKILDNHFETFELCFVEGLLQSGMRVLDIGANHGLYTLLAARRVGPAGRVVAFEPSPRERRKLNLHLRLNRCANVAVDCCALGSAEDEADFFMVDGEDTGCNSLRPPRVDEPTSVMRVPVRTLDRCLQLRGIDRVDFIKIDVEGGEWEVLKGARELLDRRPRPVILCEVQDIRTQPWGYRGSEIIEFLRHRKFHWFGFSTQGKLEPLDVRQASFDGNFVAVPAESLDKVRVTERRTESEVFSTAGRLEC